MKCGTELIAAERERQVSKEGWTPEHDDKEHPYGELIEAAICYCEWADKQTKGDDPERAYGRMPEWWPWEPEDWKPRDAVRNLVKAGALIAAEIDRLQRAAERQGEGG